MRDQTPMSRTSWLISRSHSGLMQVRQVDEINWDSRHFRVRPSLPELDFIHLRPTYPVEFGENPPPFADWENLSGNYDPTI